MTIDKDRKFLTLKEKSKLYYLKNRESIIAKSRAWQQAHPERAAANKARWMQDNRIKAVGYSRAYYDRKRAKMAVARSLVAE